jgi:hypothetical protein
MRSCFLAIKDLPPPTDDEKALGFAEANLFWNVGKPFADQPALSETEAFLRTAEAMGFDRAAFRRFKPSRPGFVARAKVALTALVGHENDSEPPQRSPTP